MKPRLEYLAKGYETVWRIVLPIFTTPPFRMVLNLVVAYDRGMEDGECHRVENCVAATVEGVCRVVAKGAINHAQAPGIVDPPPLN